MAPPLAPPLTGFRGCHSGSLRLPASMASPLTVAGISREEPRARRRLGSPAARGAGGLSHTSASSPKRLELRQRRPGPPRLRRPLQLSSGLRGPLVRRRASGEGARQVAAGEATRGGRGRRVSRRGRLPGGMSGAPSAGISVTRRGLGVPEPLRLWGGGGWPLRRSGGLWGRGRERFPCPESPCAGIARFRDEGTISGDPGHLGDAVYSLARSRGHGKP